MQRLNPLNATALARNPLLATAREYESIRRIYLSDEPDGKRWFHGGILTGSFQLSPNVALKSITSYTKVGVENLHSETDGTDVRLGIQDRREVTRSWQQEVNLTFDAMTGRITGVVGAYYNSENWELNSTLSWLANPQGFVSVGPRLPVNTATVSFFDQDTTTKAVFTDLQLRITDTVSLYGGYRFNEDKRRLILTTGLAGLPNEVGLAACNNREFEATFNSQTGKLGLKLDLGENGNAYLQVQEGFKAGGFNPFGCNDTFEPEKLTALEVGYKQRAFDGALTFSLAAFHYDYSQLQVAQIINNTNRIENAAAATITGLELEAQWRPSPNLRVDTALAFLSSRYDEYFDLDTLNRALGVQDLSGNPLNRAPNFSGSIGLEADVRLGAKGVATLRGEVYHSSRIYFRPFEQLADSQGAYSLLNFYANYRPAGTDLTVRAYIKNATNENYLAGLFSAGLFADRWAVWGAPRTYGVGVSLLF